jgi:hypothetical protein
VKAKQSYDPNCICNYCREIDHLIYACPIKKDKPYNMTWVLKGTTSNHEGPKKV